jgi:rare lipoprotein A
MPSTTDDRSPRQARGLVFKLSPLLGLLMLGACMPGGTFPGSRPTTQSSDTPNPPIPSAPIQIAFAAITIEPSQSNEAQQDELDLSLAREVGLGSWYGPRFQGRRTSSGERFNQHELTAAHRTLPFGSRVRVTNVENGQSVELRITDRGPRSPKRIIDISHAAAKEIGLKRQGIGVVQVDLLPDLGGGVLAQQSPARAGARPVN